MSSKIVLLVAGLIFFSNVSAQEKPASDAQELADKLSNPVASLISVPFQSNVDYGIGDLNGSKFTLNFQPVIPIKLSPKLNLITRYIIPIVDQHDISGAGNSEFGLSDATISAFFSPVGGKGGFIWGAGPAFLVPIGTDDLLSTRKWGIGPTLLVLKQAKGLTYGFLTNQIWSFAGDDDRSDLNQLFLQPFLSKSWKSGASVSVNSEITCNWEQSYTLAYLNPVVSGVTKLGKQTVSIAVGPRVPLGGPDEHLAAFGFRGVITLVFPQ
ncbi:hypothetical protein GZH53_14950 [Flavihumibacter sp. R14]|nr:hypothetical protein [Flavihumibacter soli]